MTWGTRLKACAVLAMAIVGVSLSTASAVGLVPATPPHLIAPVIAMMATGFVVVKLAAAGGALFVHAVSKT
jgi:hypothetical protein